MGAAVAGTTPGPEIPATETLGRPRRGPQNGLQGLVSIRVPDDSVRPRPTPRYGTRPPGLSASGRTDSGLAAGGSSRFPGNTEIPSFAGGFCFVRTEVVLRACEGRVFWRLRPIAGFLQTARLAYGCLPARWQRSRSRGGESDFSPETARSTSAAPRRGQPIAPRPVSSLRRAASEAEARCPSRAAWAVAIARGHRGVVLRDQQERAAAARDHGRGPCGSRPSVTGARGTR